VPAQDPGVVAQVVAVERLAPVVRRADGPPQGRVGLLQRLGIGGQDPGDVVGAVTRRPLVVTLVQPEEVEDADEPVRTRRPRLRPDGDRSAESVGGGPGDARVAGPAAGLGTRRHPGEFK
jgi:hypothetical protein